MVYIPHRYFFDSNRQFSLVLSPWKNLNRMAKETISKDNPVVDALRKLKEEEVELVAKLKPVQEAIAALEKIVDKTVKKAKPSGSRETVTENGSEENVQDSGAEA